MRSELLLEALACRNQGRPPIWLMRQAGRYLPQYRALREKHSLLKLFHTPDLIVEVTMQPVSLLGVDAAILFSDILIVLDALKIKYDFQEKKGPIIEPLSFGEKLKTTSFHETKDTLSFVFEAIAALKNELKVPLIGFAGAPLTIASYLIEGGSSREFKKVKEWLYTSPESFDQLLEGICKVIGDFVELQIEAGVEAIQLFDSWANILPYSQFKSCSLKFLDILIKRVKGRVPVILFCRNSAQVAKELSSIAPQGISIDWTGDLRTARQLIGPNIALQGNLDPSIFYGSIEEIEKEAEALLASMEGDPGYIFNLGHGMLPDAPVEKVMHLIRYVQERNCGNTKRR